jgi:CHAT domain-containing protein
VGNGGALDDIVRRAQWLMTGLFQASARDPKLSHAEALQKSMLSMIDNAQSDDDAHPRIWAPFVVVGEPVKAR